MRDVLFLTHRIPYPPNKGDKIRAYHVLRYLQAHCRVHLGTFIDHPGDAVHAPALAAGCASACMVRLEPGLARWRSLRGLATGAALSVRYYQDRTLQRWVDDTLRDHDIGAVLACSGPMAQYLPVIDTAGGQPPLRIIDLVDVDSEKWRAYAGAASWPLSALYRREARRLLGWERRVAQHGDHTVLVSAAEAALFRRLAPESAHKVGHFNNGVDSGFFTPDSGLANPYPAGANLVFTGALDYQPNIEAVTWFAQRVLPCLQSRLPGVRFHIVGMRPADRVLALRRLAGVAVHANVPDVRPYLQHAALAVAPLLLARGVQNKVLEAMAMEKAVVATPQALEGISAVPQREVLVAADDGAFVAAILGALDEPAAMLAMGVCARQRVLRDYRWEHNLQALGALLRFAPAGALEPAA